MAIELRAREPSGKRTGDAHLFGFFGFPPYIAEIDKATSQTLVEAPLDTLDVGTAFAFASWGGDFWIFTAPNGTSSQIDRYQPAVKTTTTVKTNLGFKVVGAGVSTCAPLVAPKQAAVSRPVGEAPRSVREASAPCRSRCRRSSRGAERRRPSAP